ncbi:MAG: ATP-binding protein [Candidatus Magnetominusculus sp. LBB02]|nr:ATP-binding protein [Candidatus Magnetominusculus sp. LBB02]
MENNNKKERRIICYLNTPRLIASTLAIAVALLAITITWTKDRAIKRLHKQTTAKFNEYRTDILNRLNDYIAYPQLLSDTPHIKEYLRHPANQNEINEYLSSFNKTVNASQVYIIAKDGVVTASSNYKAADSFVGKNFGFRNYFQTAMKGIPGEQIAIGTITKKLGYYRSSSVKDGNEIIGAAVIKFDINLFAPQDLEKDEILMIADYHDVIFNTNNKRYLYHAIHKLSESTLKQIIDDKEFDDEPLTPLPIINESEKNDIKFVTMREPAQKGYNDVEYMMVGAYDNSSMWNVHLLTGLSGVEHEIRRNVVVVLLLMFIFYLAAAYLSDKAKSRQNLQERYLDLLEQKSIIERHEKDEEELNSALKYALSSEALEVHLQRKLDIILEHFKSQSQPKGCIFLHDETFDLLQMAVHRGFSEEHLRLCASVPDGKCLCGLASATKEVVFASHKEDERHTIYNDLMADHGHYCVPIISTDRQSERLLGVINIYVDAGYQRNDEDETFIKNIAHVIAGVILRKKELKLIELNRTESMTTLAAGIAHEINNPLSFIKSSIGSFKRNLIKIEQYIKDSQALTNGADAQTEPPQVNIAEVLSLLDKKIDTSNKGINRIMEVVNGLTQFSRINRADDEEVDINKSIDEALSMLLPEDNAVTIIKEYAELPPLRCEARAINQCFYHIIQNALQAVDKNAGTIRIATIQTVVADIPEFIMIKIGDNGHGMTQEQIKRAFDPFYTTKDVGSGRGLGLSIVDGVIKRHGGTVAIDSRQAEGTTVTIHLPLVHNAMYF